MHDLNFNLLGGKEFEEEKLVIEVKEENFVESCLIIFRCQLAWHTGQEKKKDTAPIMPTHSVPSADRSYHCISRSLEHIEISVHFGPVQIWLFLYG